MILVVTLTSVFLSGFSARSSRRGGIVPPLPLVPKICSWRVAYRSFVGFFGLRIAYDRRVPGTVRLKKCGTLILTASSSLTTSVVGQYLSHGHTGTLSQESELRDAGNRLWSQNRRVMPKMCYTLLAVMLGDIQ